MNPLLKWCDKWYPTKGDALEIGLGYKDGAFVQYSDCELDTVEYRFKPDTIRLRGLSTGVLRSVSYTNGVLTKTPH